MWSGTACAPYEVDTFPTLRQQARGSAVRGEAGGVWSACTHLKRYGLNTAPALMRFLAFGVRPRSALEIGCGLGTTADFLARQGGTMVTCIEPEPMLAEVFAARPLPLRPTQLSIDLFKDKSRQDEGTAACADALVGRGFSLVYSFEVAEHVPPAKLGDFVRLLARATSRLLVFSAARPGQAGTGHQSGSMLPKHRWAQLLEREGLVLLPRLSALASRAAFPERCFDIAPNVIVLRAANASDVDELEEAERAAPLVRREPVLLNGLRIRFDRANASGADAPWHLHAQSPPPNWMGLIRAVKPLQQAYEAALWPELAAIGANGGGVC